MIGGVAVIPVTDDPWADHLDKLVHLCEYLLLAWLMVRAFRADTSPRRAPRRSAWLAATGYGVLLELVQGILPWRSAGLADVMTNALGAGLGVWVGRKAVRSR